MGHFQQNFHYLSTMGEYWASCCISTGSLLIKAVGVPLKVSSSTSYSGHSRTWSGWVTICLSGIQFHCSKPCNRLAHYSSHGPWVVVFFLLGKTLTVILGAYEGSALRGDRGTGVPPPTYDTH